MMSEQVVGSTARRPALQASGLQAAEDPLSSDFDPSSSKQRSASQVSEDFESRPDDRPRKLDTDVTDRFKSSFCKQITAEATGASLTPSSLSGTGVLSL